MKRSILLIFLFSLTLICSSCKKSPDTVTVVLDWIPNTNHTGLYVAAAKGFYNDEGITVKIVEPPEDGALMLLASGKADFGISFQEDIGLAITADIPLPVVAVAAIVQHNTSGIISLDEKNIRTPKDMENHNYATWGLPIEQGILKHVVEKDGGDYSKIELVPSTVTDVISALLTGIDTVWVYYTWDGIAAEIMGVPVNFFYFKDIDPVFDFYTPVIASSENYLEKNNETAAKFLKATAKGYEYAINNPEEAADILCAAAPEIDRDIAVASQIYLSGQYKAGAPYWGYIDPARWDGFFNWLGIGPGLGYTNDFLK